VPILYMMIGNLKI